MIIAVDVTMPWPTSARGRAKEARPSVPIVTVMSAAVGAAARVSRSLRSRISAGCGGVGTTASAEGAPVLISAPVTRVAPAMT